LVSASLLVTSVAAAQQDGLPPGHPPTGGEPATAPPMPVERGMPPGHPPMPAGTPAGSGEAMPAGHPPVPGVTPAPPAGQGMPPGPPPMPGATAPGQGMPPGHPSVPGATPPAQGMPAGHPAVPGGAGMTGQGRLPSVLQPPSLASQEPNEELPAGTIRVTVV